MRSILLAGLAGLVLAVAAPAAEDDDLHRRATQLFRPIPSAVPSVPGNPVTREKIDLGRMLFFDPRISASGILSCNSCHNLAMGGGDNVETSIGHGWQRGPRNAPTVLNAVFNASQFWDGRAADLRARRPVRSRQAWRWPRRRSTCSVSSTACPSTGSASPPPFPETPRPSASPTSPGPSKPSRPRWSRRMRASTSISRAIAPSSPPRRSAA